MNGLRIGDFELFWLNGGRFELDGGTMFGVVPKLLWRKKYPVDDENYIPLAAWPILVRTPGSLVLIESGLGNKLTDKQKKIFRLKEEWGVIEDLNMLSIKREEIDFVILTHYDFDHAGGVVMRDGDGLTLTFPNAKHVIQLAEWEDVLSPNIRSVNTYWAPNVELLKQKGKVELVNGEAEILKGLKVFSSGGHTRGHQIIRMESHGEVALHLGDLLPTHAHYNPLWVTAYDNFPLDAINSKKAWEDRGAMENAWFTFYHDPFIQACRFDEKGNVTEKWSLVKNPGVQRP